MGPITTTGLTEMPWLREIIVIIVTELGVSGITAWAREVLLFRRRAKAARGKGLGGGLEVVAGV